MKPLQEENHIGMGEGDMSDREAEALKSRLQTMQQLARKRVEGHHEKMRKLVNTKRGDDALGSQPKGGQH